MKFLCDQMLVKLGRWLRFAGYDTAIVQRPCKDREILEKALAQNRLILTRDRHFLEFKEGQGHIIWLVSNHLDDCIQELNHKAGIDWTLCPFSRCSVCNTILLKANEEQTQNAPEAVRQWCEKYRYCPQCGKLYWEGSHTDKILRQLIEWKEIR